MERGLDGWREGGVDEGRMERMVDGGGGGDGGGLDALGSVRTVRCLGYRTVRFGSVYPGTETGLPDLRHHVKITCHGIAFDSCSFASSPLL